MIELAMVRERLPVCAEAAWSVLADFDHPQRLAPTIESASVNGSGIGAVRVVSSSRGLEIHERLLELDPVGYRLRYAILDDGDMPFAHVTSYACTVTLVPVSEGITEILWRSEGTVNGPIDPIRAFLTTLYANAGRRIVEDVAGRRGASCVSEPSIALDRLLADAVERGAAPGLVGIVADADGDLYVGTRGNLEVSIPAAMSVDTIFWIASMTKLVTTVATMQLVESGRLSLDAPVGELLPELADPKVLKGFDADGRAVLRSAQGIMTLRQLLTHSSGIGYDIMNPRLLRARGPDGPPPSTSLASLRGPLVFDPGCGWEYGFGIDWAGLAIERCTGMTLDRYFAEFILGPLGMRSTGFGIHAEAPDRCATTHLRQTDGGVSPISSPIGLPEDWEFFSGGAGLCGTAVDYVRLLRMLLRGGELDGRRLLLSSTVDEMWRNQIGAVGAGVVDTALPALCLPFDSLPGQRGEWSLLGLRNAEHVTNGRRAGSASWVGAAGTFFWIDREVGICVVLMAQLLPFADPALAEVRRDFEAAVYADVAALRPVTDAVR